MILWTPCRKKQKREKYKNSGKLFFLSSHLDFIDTLCQFKFNQLKVHKSLSLPCVFFESKLLLYRRQISMASLGGDSVLIHIHIYIVYQL